MKRFLSVILASLIIVGCSSITKHEEQNISQENLVLATIWFQSSPEAKALFYQGFNLAKERVLEYSKLVSKNPKAVVVDLDETMIDNSPFQGKMIETAKGFTSEFWAEWVTKEEALAMPGAVEFTKFCYELGVEVIFISNRTVSELQPTMNNMHKLGFSFVKPENFFLKTDKSGKEPRRLEVAKKFEVILLLGDNLNDFAEFFENRGDDWGASVVEKYREEFGKKFILFPNPMYGEWEKNIYNHQRVTDEDLKFQLRHQAVQSYK
jgi:5'-nucleotidase (lipoprotein e(P4) family)